MEEYNDETWMCRENIKVVSVFRQINKVKYLLFPFERTSGLVVWSNFSWFLMEKYCLRNWVLLEMILSRRGGRLNEIKTRTNIAISKCWRWKALESSHYCTLKQTYLMHWKIENSKIKVPFLIDIVSKFIGRSVRSCRWKLIWFKN